MNPFKARVVAMWLLHRRRKRRHKIRSQWVHPINQRRTYTGIFHTLYVQLRSDEDKFFNYFRMSKASFDELHEKLQGAISHQNSKMRNSITSVERLAVALRYFASGSTFTDLHYSYRMGVSTIRSIVEEVSKAIWTVMRKECMPELTKEKWEAIASGFEKRAQFPHCLGAVDGKHIRITRPMHSGSMFYNYKEYYSVVLLAVVDSNYKFVYVNVGSYGKECDSSIFKESTLWKSIESDKLELPDEMCLLGSESPKMPYFFVGDEAFGLNKHLMRPFGGSHLTLKKRIFNYRLCRARRYVECGFGILTNKWRIFHRPLNVEPEFAVEIVKASVLLHNFVRDRDGYLPEDTTTIIGLEDLPRDNMARGGLEANSTRNILSDYFLTNVGSVPWQMNKI